MEMDLALGRFGGEVGRDLADLQHWLPPIDKNSHIRRLYHNDIVSQYV
jgi:hypothetical protein